MATKKKWSAKVDTDSTHPAEGLFTKSPPAIARALASKKVSPKGPGSGMRVLTFYINRAGKNLPKERHAALEKAKTILSGIIATQKEKDEPTASKKSPAKKSSVKKISQRPAKRTAATSRTKKKVEKKAA
jgi:tRNA(adenine34) deaminase